MIALCPVTLAALRPRKHPFNSAPRASQASTAARASGPTPLQLQPSSDLFSGVVLVIGLIARLSTPLRHRRRARTGSTPSKRYLVLPTRRLWPNLNLYSLSFVYFHASLHLTPIPRI